MAKGASKLSAGSNSYTYGNTKFTVIKQSNGFYLQISSANGNGITTKHKIAYAKNPDKARVYVGPSIGYINFKDDPNMLKILKNVTKG